MSSVPLPEKTISVPFMAKKFDYNRYHIKYNDIEGILNLANVVADVVKPPREFSVPNPTNETIVGVRLVPIASFTNQGRKIKPSKQPNADDISTADSVDITNFIRDEDKQEPWNEYALAHDPPKILKTKTTLLRILLVVDRDDGFGNPLFNLNHNTVHVVIDHPASEAGSR